MGRIQFAVAGQAQGKPFDAYAKGTARVDADFGEADFTAGDNEISCEVVGSHPQSTGHLVGIKQLVLTPVPDADSDGN
jgi:hypothetical protein